MSRAQRILKLGLVILYIIIFVKQFNYAVLSIIAICIHELSHLLFLRFNFINLDKFEVSVLGFRIDLSDRVIVDNELLMYCIGSIANLLCCVVFLVIRMFFEFSIFDKFIIANFVIGCFNLIPIFPLDGAFILKNILFKFLKQYVAMFVSIFVSFALSICGLILVLSAFFVFSTFNVTYLIVIVFSLISTYEEYKALIGVFVVNRIDSLKCVFLKKGYIRSDVVSVYYDTYIIDLIKLCRLHRFVVFYFIDDNLEIIGIMNHHNVLQCYKKFGNIRIRDYYKNK